MGRTRNYPNLLVRLYLSSNPYPSLRLHRITNVMLELVQSHIDNGKVVIPFSVESLPTSSLRGFQEFLMFHVCKLVEFLRHIEKLAHRENPQQDKHGYRLPLLSSSSSCQVASADFCLDTFVCLLHRPKWSR